MLWVDVLNLALDWRDAERAPQAGGAGIRIPEATRPALRRDVALLRRIFASYYLEVPLAPAYTEQLNEWLAAVTLRSGRAPQSPPTLGLRAARAREAQSEPFETLLSSALVQLLGQIDQAHLMAAVHRCHGIQRRVAARDSAAWEWPGELREGFARKADSLVLLRDAAWCQCARLVVSERGSRYCSKACSNASFVARKSRRDPRYFAQKQQRYRERKDKPPRTRAARLDRGAFVYMD